MLGMRYSRHQTKAMCEFLWNDQRKRHRQNRAVARMVEETVLLRR
jgi:hypothetical protein